MTDHIARQAGLTDWLRALADELHELDVAGDSATVGWVASRIDARLAAYSADARNGDGVADQIADLIWNWAGLNDRAQKMGCIARIRAILAAPAYDEFCQYCGGNDEHPQDHCVDCTRPAAPAPTLDHLPFPWHVSQANLGVTGATYKPVEVRAANRATVLRVGNDDSALPLANLIVALSQSAPAPAAQADDSVLWSLNRELGAALSEARRPIINRQQTTALMQMVNVALSQQSATPAGSTAANFDDYVVEQFAVAMKRKLAAARAKGRDGWQYCTQEDLSRMLREHVEKGDARDVANFCMFLWYHGHAIVTTPADAASEADKRDEMAYTLECAVENMRLAGELTDSQIESRWRIAYKLAQYAKDIRAASQRERQQGA